MENIGNSENDLNLFEFQKKFSSDEDCLKHLSSIKWNSGFECKKCSIHTIVKVQKSSIDSVAAATM